MFIAALGLIQLLLGVKGKAFAGVLHQQSSQPREKSRFMEKAVNGHLTPLACLAEGAAED